MQVNRYAQVSGLGPPSDLFGRCPGQEHRRRLAQLGRGRFGFEGLGISSLRLLEGFYKDTVRVLYA